MSQQVTKVVGYAIVGPKSASVAVTKIVGYVIYDTLGQATPVAKARNKVRVRARLIPGS